MNSLSYVSSNHLQFLKPTSYSVTSLPNQFTTPILSGDISAFLFFSNVDENRQRLFFFDMIARTSHWAPVYHLSNNTLLCCYPFSLLRTSAISLSSIFFTKHDVILDFFKKHCGICYWSRIVLTSVDCKTKRQYWHFGLIFVVVMLFDVKQLAFQLIAMRTVSVVNLDAGCIQSKRKV